MRCDLLFAADEESGVPVLRWCDTDSVSESDPQTDGACVARRRERGFAREGARDSRSRAGGRAAARRGLVRRGTYVGGVEIGVDVRRLPTTRESGVARRALARWRADGAAHLAMCSALLAPSSALRLERMPRLDAASSTPRGSIATAIPRSSAEASGSGWEVYAHGAVQLAAKALFHRLDSIADGDGWTVAAEHELIRHLALCLESLESSPQLNPNPDPNTNPTSQAQDSLYPNLPIPRCCHDTLHGIHRQRIRPTTGGQESLQVSETGT